MEYVLFAGPNGSGKSTIIKALRDLEKYQGFSYVCADEVEKELTNISGEDKLKTANQIARDIRGMIIAQDHDMIYESVVSHPSHLDDLKEIQSKGNTITLVYVTTADPQINIDRVNNRGRDNDWYLSPDKIKGRYSRSLDLLYNLIELADTGYVFDNSQETALVFYKSDMQYYSIKKTEWVNEYIIAKLNNNNQRYYNLEDCAEAKMKDKELLARFIDKIKKSTM